MIRLTLVVMVKEPRAGRCKTRLARGIGVVGATQFYRMTTAAVLARVSRRERLEPVRTWDGRRQRRDPGLAEWDTVLAVAPDTEVRSRTWPSRLARVGQGAGDLGQRMQRVMNRPTRGPVVIIGSDVPAIRRDHIRAAFGALGSQDAVFGPASDGGYWLIGLKRFPRVPRLFACVRWSTRHALADTRANLAGFRVAEVATLDDIDEAADLARLVRCPGQRVL